LPGKVKDAFPGQSPCFELQSFESQSMESLAAEIDKHKREQAISTRSRRI
jgi:hypothetical protein